MENSDKEPANLQITQNDGQSWKSFETNLKGVNYLATTGVNSQYEGTNNQLFAIDGKNQFLLQSSPDIYDQFVPLKEVFANEDDRIDLSNWTLYSVAWTRPDNLGGIFNFL